MKTYTAEEWFELSKNISDLINKDIDNLPPEYLSEVYPKLVVMYEFFRLLRGEAFRSSRPEDLGGLQSQIYKMQDDIGDGLANLKAKIDPSDSKAQYHLDVMKKSFMLK